MNTISDIFALRDALAVWRKAGLKIAFVPTMGNLHAGHLSLIDEARKRADKVVASIFVNPLQFAQGEDFVSYPRTLEQDSRLLEKHQTDILFTPSEAVLYPQGKDSVTQIIVPRLSDILCGHFRPGHFAGVATVVAKLFNIVQPHIALFGRKDFQQLLVIRKMVADLNMPIEIIGLPTVREADGLAMSSRNHYLSPEDRQGALLIYKVLREISASILQGQRDLAGLQAAGLKTLVKGGFSPDYVEIRNPEDLMPSNRDDADFVILAAAKLGRTRLIDNVEISTLADI